MSITPTITDQWSDGKRLHVTGTLAFTGNYVANGVAIDFPAAGVRANVPPSILLVPTLRGFIYEYVPGLALNDGKLKVYGAGDTAATGTLTSDNTNVANNDTVTIGGQTYTFKTNLTASTTANEVHIGADADGSLLNLIRAINGTGTPGTDYGSLTAVNTSVSAAAAVTAHAFAVTAKVSGTGGNSIASTEASAHLSWGGATLSGGVNSTATSTELSAAAFPTSLTNSAIPFYLIVPQFI